MDIEYQLRLQITRRQLFGRTAKGIGVAALASLLGPDGLLAETDLTNPKTGGLVGLPHFPARAKRVIFLFQSGGPSQLELFDHQAEAAGVARHPAAGLDSPGSKLDIPWFVDLPDCRAYLQI